MQPTTLDKLSYCIDKLGATEAAIQLHTPSRTVRHWRHTKRIPAHSAHLLIEALYGTIRGLREEYQLEAEIDG